MSAEEEKATPVSAEEEEEKEEVSAGEEEEKEWDLPMAVAGVLKQALFVNGLARGLNEAAKAID
jgi:hypothetical protein